MKKSFPIINAQWVLTWVNNFSVDRRREKQKYFEKCLNGFELNKFA